MLSVLAAPLSLQLPRAFPQPERVYGTRAPSCVRTARNSVHACIAEIELPQIGAQLEVSDARSFGRPPASWWRRARERARAVADPTSEAAFAAAYVGGAPEIAFAARSAHGNGVVTVVACGPWRCLKFDEVEQGVAYVKQGTVALTFEYLRVMAAAALAFGRLQAPAPQRVLCVGLGAAALPGWLAHYFDVGVEVVELDPLVARVAEEELGRERGGAGYDVVIGDAAAHVRGLRGAGLGCVLLDAFDRDGETPAHLLTADGFLRDAYDALAAGGTLVVNRFNGVDGSAERAAFAQTARELRSAGFAEIYSLGVDGLSVVLVARRAAPGARRPGRADLQSAARAAWEAGGLAGGDGARLVRRLLWVDLAADGGVSERRPPRENLARKSCDVMILGAASSASPRWMGGSS